MADHLPYTRNCFVCGSANPHGLALRFTGDETGVRTEFTPQSAHAGYPGVLHGGALGAALDEAMFWAATHRVGRMHMSVEMTVRYKAKVRIGQTHEIFAALDGQTRGMCRTSARLVAADGTVCATATGKYLPLPVEDEAAVLQDFHPDERTLPPQRFASG